MDPRFMKWMADVAGLYASNLDAIKKMAGRKGAAWPSFPGVPEPPFSTEKMEDLYREWLLLFGAVPKNDYDELRRKVEMLEARCEKMNRAMEAMTQGMSAVKDAPEVMKPWIELADQAARAHQEWLGELRKSMEALGGAAGRKDDGHKPGGE